MEIVLYITLKTFYSMVEFNGSGDGQYCGSFQECGVHCFDSCPVNILNGICDYVDGYYLDYYLWPSLDYLVCVPCR